MTRHYRICLSISFSRDEWKQNKLNSIGIVRGQLVVGRVRKGMETSNSIDINIGNPARTVLAPAVGQNIETLFFSIGNLLTAQRGSLTLRTFQRKVPSNIF